MHLQNHALKTHGTFPETQCPSLRLFAQSPYVVLQLIRALTLKVKYVSNPKTALAAVAIEQDNPAQAPI